MKLQHQWSQKCEENSSMALTSSKIFQAYLASKEDQLVLRNIFQAVRVNLVQVLDRVMLRSGGRSWWATALARARAEQMWKAHRRGGKAVCNNTSLWKFCSLALFTNGATLFSL